MKRLYYLANDLASSREVAEAMRAANVRERHFHALSRDESGLAREGIHAATTYQQLDVVHTGVRYALVGGIVGVMAGYALIRFESIPLEYQWLVVGIAAVLFGCFGAWQGGMLGLSRENYKLAPFHNALNAGKHLLMIDVRPGNEGPIRELMIKRFPNVQPGGSDTTLVNPFASAQQVHPQNTH